jgi:hypothetical protein
MATNVPKRRAPELAAADNLGEQVICHWFDTQQGRWRDDLTSAGYCVNQLHGNPQVPAPATDAVDIPASFPGGMQRRLE